VRYRHAGRDRLLTLGRHGVLTVQQARNQAGDALRSVTQGADPLADRQDARDRLTVSEFAKLYMTRHAKPRKKSWKEDQRRLQKYIVPAWGARALDSIRRSDVAAMHARIGEKSPTEANRTLALVSIMYSLAGEWGQIPETAPNPAARVRKFKEKSRDRWVTPAELPRLLEAIQAEESPHIRGLFLLYLLTGMRKSELLTLRWDAVDLDRREIRLGDTKQGRTHVVPLSPEAVEILDGLPHYLGNPHVFPSSNQPGEPTRYVHRPWVRIRERAGLQDVRLHDLRRTVGSWLATSGASLPLIGKVLGHSNASTTQVYARLAEDAPRKALANASSS
jgi:integrase